MKIKQSILSVLINAIIMALLIEYDIFETQTFFGKVVICLIVVIVTKIISNLLS